MSFIESPQVFAVRWRLLRRPYENILNNRGARGASECMFV
jgi:hypothetical protein